MSRQLRFKKLERNQAAGILRRAREHSTDRPHPPRSEVLNMIENFGVNAPRRQRSAGSCYAPGMKVRMQDRKVYQADRHGCLHYLYQESARP